MESEFKMEGVLGRYGFFEEGNKTCSQSGKLWKLRIGSSAASGNRGRPHAKVAKSRRIAELSGPVFMLGSPAPKQACSAPLVL